MIRILCISALILSQFAVGQSTGSIYGRITDSNADGEPLIFASVGLKDTPFTEQTNFHGNFEMTGIPLGSHILRVSYLGYEPKEVAINVAPGKLTLVETSLQLLATTTESLVLTEASAPPSITADKAAKQ
ncbi:MAG: carboxypeptidase-like regulatory domain-containing protein [Bacteroidota bacterium]